MSDKKVIEGLEWILKDDRFGFGVNWENGKPRDDYEIAGKIITDTIALLKEQEDMISITTVAEFLADNATPQPNAERWEKVMAWEQFLLGLKGRKTGND